MISAEEARRIASDVENKKNQEQLGQIEKAIHTEANKGAISVSVNFWPTESIVNLLESQGYKVETFSERNESWTQITWG